MSGGGSSPRAGRPPSRLAVPVDGQAVPVPHLGVPLFAV